ncbi:MAG: hypothetical protein V4495_05115 [Pseudomonadota bacterium]
MLEDLPDVPPVVLMLLVAFAESSSWEDNRKRIKSMLKDLRDQSVAYEAQCLENKPTKANPLQFDVHLHGGLDLFDGRGACSDLACRLQVADRVCRSMGLIADRIWLTDLITEKFVNFGRATNAKLDEIVADSFVLSRLAPLILEGIIRFRSPWNPVCKSCLERFDETVLSLSSDIAREFKKEARFRSRKNGNYVLDTGGFFEPSVIYSNIEPINPLPTLRGATETIIYNQIRSAMWVSRHASLLGGSIFSNSRVGLTGLLKQDGRFSDSKRLMLLDSERSIMIPWVSELDPEQVLQLRQEAANALPLFREMMAKTLTVDDDMDGGTQKSRAFISDLREQAEVVRSELSTVRKNSGRFWKTTYGLLGLGLSAYGVASDHVIPGVGGLLPLIQLLINHKIGHEKDVDELTYRPGYVLVKAQDLLIHAQA